VSDGDHRSKKADILSTTQSVLEVGGRLASSPSDALVASAFQAEVEAGSALFHGVSLADLAHTVMLTRSGVIPKAASRELLSALLELHDQSDSFLPEPKNGDIYTNREAWLAGKTESVGWLGAARARREAMTTGLHIGLRSAIIDLIEEVAGACDVIVDLSSAHHETLMPDYTYLQIAQPTTFGHYLLGFGFPLMRDMERLGAVLDNINKSPAGCGSANGSIIDQDRAWLSDVLGFDEPMEHGRDAMWQADMPVQLAGALTSLLINLDRLAEDLFVFSTQEFGLVELSDAHARASKIMPQKKNPFALSYVRSAANRMIGLQTEMSAIGRTPSGQMDNRLSAYSQLPMMLENCKKTVTLMAEVLRDLKFDAAQAAQSLAENAAFASDLAEYIMLESSLDFRSAHKTVGYALRKIIDDARSLDTLSIEDLERAAMETHVKKLELDPLILAKARNPKEAVNRRTCLGGAAPDQVLTGTKILNERVNAYLEIIGEKKRSIERAEADLIKLSRKLAKG